MPHTSQVYDFICYFIFYQDPFDLDQPCMDQKLNLEQKAQLGAFTKEFDMYTALEIMLEFILTFVKGSNGIIQAEWT